MVILILSVWGAAAVIIISLGTSDDQFINALGVVVNGAFSAFLIYIYTGMRNIQDEQTDIQDNQRRLMEANHEPAIDICGVSRPGDNKVGVEISNLGNGVAQDLQIRTEVSTTSTRFEGKLGYYDLELVDEEADRGGSIIQPDEECLMYAGRVVVGVYDNVEGSDLSMAIDGFLSELRASNADDSETNISIDVDLIFTNIIDDSGDEDLLEASDVIVREETRFHNIPADVDFVFS